MRILVWIGSGLLAVIFLAVGGMKVLAPAAELQKSAGGVPVELLRLAGAAELLGGLGLVLPAATRILPTLTPVAATGLTVTMLGASIANLVVGAYAALPMTIGLGVVCALIGWARSSGYRVQPRVQVVPAGRLNSA